VTLDAASAEHQAALTSAEQRSKGDQLTSDDLKDAMTQHWRHISKARRELKLTVSAKKKATRPSNVPNVAKEVAAEDPGDVTVVLEAEEQDSKASATAVARKGTEPLNAGRRMKTRIKGRHPAGRKAA
jgi:uncharacterized coiled-coil protein SlyX